MVRISMMVVVKWMVEMSRVMVVVAVKWMVRMMMMATHLDDVANLVCG